MEYISLCTHFLYMVSLKPLSILMGPVEIKFLKKYIEWKIEHIELSRIEAFWNTFWNTLITGFIPFW